MTKETNTTAPALLAAKAILSQHSGVIEYADRSALVRFIHIAAAANSKPSRAPAGNNQIGLIAALEREAFEADQLVIFAPDADPDPERLGVVARIQLLVHAKPLDEHHHANDRFHAYHGDPSPLILAECTIDSVRVMGLTDDTNTPTDLVVGGDELCRHTLPPGTESPALRKLNADKHRLAAACAHRLGVRLNQPTAIGVDALGIDIRAQFGILRLPWPASIPTEPTPETLLQLVDELLAPSDNPAT